MYKNVPRTDPEIMERILDIYNELGDIIWWCKTINNPIYDVDENGVRHPRDLYQIRAGFGKAYNEFFDRGIRINNAE